MTGFRRSLIYLVVFAVIATAGGVFIANAINRPVAGSTRSYQADFTNASGLRAGNDVRMLGTRVGKVTSVALRQGRASGTTVAQVSFTLDTKQHIYPDSRLAIRYLNLTGIRYVDLQQQSQSGQPLESGTPIGISSTEPSFDITAVFHGLAPVFAVMNPDDINHFSKSLLMLIEGDGSGFGNVIDSLTKVLTFVDDRSALIDVLVDNLRHLSDSIGGRASNITPLVGYLSTLGAILARRLPDLRNLADSAGAVLVSANQFLGALGLENGATPDLNATIRQIMPAAQSVVGLLTLTPGILNSLNSVLPSPDAPAELTCSKGSAPLPSDIALFVRAKQVTLCKR